MHSKNDRKIFREMIDYMDSFGLSVIKTGDSHPEGMMICAQYDIDHYSFPITLMFHTVFRIIDFRVNVIEDIPKNKISELIVLSNQINIWITGNHFCIEQSFLSVLRKGGITQIGNTIDQTTFNKMLELLLQDVFEYYELFNKQIAGNIDPINNFVNFIHN